MKLHTLFLVAFLGLSTSMLGQFYDSALAALVLYSTMMWVQLVLRLKARTDSLRINPPVKSPPPPIQLALVHSTELYARLP